MPALIMLVFVGYSAQAAIRAIITHGAAPVSTAVAAPTGFDAQDHFPGAQLLYSAEPDAPVSAALAARLDAVAAPAQGVTGTADLPALPLSIAALQSPATDGTVRPALPFSLQTAAAIDQNRALECLTAAIYYEAASEPDAGQRAVAEVIFNRVRHPAFPNTVCGVVYQGSERATGCQFSFACDGSMARVPSAGAWRRAGRTAALMLAGYVEPSVGLATHYHTFAVTPAWNRSLVMTAAIGAHFFHRWQGYWGTSAAFTQHYAGGEPVPGPHTRPTPAITLANAAFPGAAFSRALAPGGLPAAALPAGGLFVPGTGRAGTPAAFAPLPITAPSQIQPRYADSGTAPATAAAQGAALPESQILDRWKDSGKPLR